MARIQREGAPAPQQSPAPTPAQPTRAAEMPDDMATISLADSPGASGPAVPQIMPSPPFLLFWHPRRWHVQAGRLVPALAKRAVLAGISGSKSTGRGDAVKVDASAMFSRATARGWTPIRQDVDGPGTSYLRRPKGTSAWLSRWERTYVGSTVIDADEDGYTQWLESLVKRGEIPEPTMSVLEQVAADLRDKLARAQNAVRVSPSESVMVERYTADLAVVNAEIARRRKSAIPAEAEIATLDV